MAGVGKPPGKEPAGFEYVVLFLWGFDDLASQGFAVLMGLRLGTVVPIGGRCAAEPIVLRCGH